MQVGADIAGKGIAKRTRKIISLAALDQINPGFAALLHKRLSITGKLRNAGEIHELFRVFPITISRRLARLIERSGFTESE